MFSCKMQFFKLKSSISVLSSASEACNSAIVLVEKLNLPIKKVLSLSAEKCTRTVHGKQADQSPKNCIKYNFLICHKFCGLRISELKHISESFSVVRYRSVNLHYPKYWEFSKQSSTFARTATVLVWKNLTSNSNETVTWKVIKW